MRLGKKRSLTFPLLELQRRAKHNTADDRHRQKLAFGENPIQVGKMHRHKLHIRPFAPKIVDAALELCNAISGAARAFGKNNQRVAPAERTKDHLHGMTSAFKLPLDTV